MANVASMQVLNQAFANANQALLGYMDNKLKKDSLKFHQDRYGDDLNSRQQALDRISQVNSMKDIEWFDALLGSDPEKAMMYASFSGLDKKFNPAQLGALADNAIQSKKKRELNAWAQGLQNTAKEASKDKRASMVEKQKLQNESRRLDHEALKVFSQMDPQAAVDYARQAGLIPGNGGGSNMPIGASNAASESDMATYNQIMQFMKDIADDERQIALGDDYGSKPSEASGTALGNWIPWGQTTNRSSRVDENRANIQKLLPLLKDAALIKSLQDQGITLNAPKEQSPLVDIMGGASNTPAAAPKPSVSASAPSAWDKRSSFGGARYLGY